MKEIKLTEAHVYGVPEATSNAIELQVHPEQSFPEKGADTRDHEIEDREYRKRFKSGEGCLSMTAQAGDDYLGQFDIGIQFEGPNHKPEECVAGHNTSIQDTSAWLKKFLEDISPENGEWELRLDAVPCPNVPFSLNVAQVINSLGAEVRVRVEPPLGPTLNVKRETKAE